MAKRLLIEILQPWRLHGRRLWERGGREVELQLNVLARPSMTRPLLRLRSGVYSGGTDGN